VSFALGPAYWLLVRVMYRTLEDYSQRICSSLVSMLAWDLTSVSLSRQQQSAPVSCAVVVLVTHMVDSLYIQGT